MYAHRCNQNLKEVMNLCVNGRHKRNWKARGWGRNVEEMFLLM